MKIANPLTSVVAPITLIAMAVMNQQPASNPGPEVEELGPPPQEQAIRIWRPGFTGGKRPLDFVPLADVIPGDEVSLSGGVTVVLADWPALFVSSTTEGSCTSALVGPSTVLTAAHCVDAERAPREAGPQTLEGKATIAGTDYELSCLMHPDYAAAPLNLEGGVRNSFDYALCHLNAAVPATRVRPETLDLGTTTQSGRAILMAGFGCTDIGVTAFGRLTYRRGDGLLRMNDENVHETALSAGSEPGGVWMSTQADRGEPTLCPGDSGGPVITGATLASQTVSRRVVGVNSAVGWAPRPGGGWIFYSFMAPVATPAFRRLIDKYRLAYPNEVICGDNRPAGAGGCRA